LTDRLRRELLLVAFVVLPGQFGRGLQLLQQRVVVDRPQPQQQLAGGDVVARVEMDLIDNAGGLRRQIGAAHRAQAPRCLQSRLPFVLGGGDAGDRLRRGSGGAHVLAHHLGHEGLPGKDAAQDQRHRDGHDYQRLDHRLARRDLCAVIGNSGFQCAHNCPFSFGVALAATSERFHHPPPSA